MARERFYFYEKWWRVLNDINDRHALAAFKAACAFVFDKEDRTDKLEPEARVAFMFMRQEIERDKEAYENACEAYRANGSRGGRPRKNQDCNEEWTQNQENQKNQSGFAETKETHKNQSGTIRVDKSGEDKKGINNSLSLSSGEEEREREIFLISLLFLRKGIKMAASEAREYYTYYQSSGWRKSNEHQTPIVDRVAYAETWKTKREAVISEDEGEFFARLVEAINFTNYTMAEDFINGYRGCIQPEPKKIRFFFSQKTTSQKFISMLQTNEEFKKRVFNHLAGFGYETINVDLACNDPRI
jgi:hypothetical protein